MGQAWQYTVTAEDPDSPAASLTYSLDGPIGDPEVTFDAATGQLSWTPSTAGQSNTFTLRVTDPDGSSTPQSFTATATAPRVGAVPVIDSVPTGPAILGQTYQYQVVAHDPNGDKITYSLANPVAGTSIDPVTGLLTLTPAAVGVIAISIIADDQIDGSRTQSFNLDVVAPANRLPRITSVPTGPAVEGQTWSYRITATDLDNDPLTFSVGYSGPETVTLVGGNTVQWIPTAAGLSLPLVIAADDGRGGSVTQSFTVNSTVVPVTDPGNVGPPSPPRHAALSMSGRCGPTLPKRPMPMAT